MQYLKLLAHNRLKSLGLLKGWIGAMLQLLILSCGAVVSLAWSYVDTQRKTPVICPCFLIADSVGVERTAEVMAAHCLAEALVSPVGMQAHEC